MSASTVHVKNIAAATSEKEVRDFFSFCGKISNLSLRKETDGKQSAAVTFEKPTAAKTALLLDNTQLTESVVEVSSAASLDEFSNDKSGVASEAGSSDELAQEDKPRSRIIAEYLAHGYTVSDKAVERAIALDNQHGFTSRFTSVLQQFDQKYQVTPTAQNIDQKYGVSEKAATGWSSLNSYFEKALGTPTGQRVRDFYVTGTKQVKDVHEEARRLADLKVPKSTPQPIPGTNETKCSCHASSAKCGCAPGACACSACPRNAANTGTDTEKMNLHQVSDAPVKTKCDCGGNQSVCACESGKCACSSCPKNSDVRS